MLESLIGHGIHCQGKDYEIVGESFGDIHSSENLVTKFDVFDTVPYTFYRLERDSVVGNRIIGSYSCEGIFDYDRGLVRNENSENVEQGAVLDIKPSEAFLVAQPANREHITLTLVPIDLSDWSSS